MIQGPPSAIIIPNVFSVLNDGYSSSYNLNVIPAT